jgi:hypothetical protein
VRQPETSTLSPLVHEAYQGLPTNVRPR